MAPFLPPFLPVSTDIALGAESRAVGHMLRGEEPALDGSRRSARMRTQNQAILPIRLSHQDIVTRERVVFIGIPKLLKKSPRTRNL